MRSALEGLDGVKSADVSLSQEQADVIYDTSAVTIGLMHEAVVDAGYGISDHNMPSPWKPDSEKVNKPEKEDSDPAD